MSGSVCLMSSWTRCAVRCCYCLAVVPEVALMIWCWRAVLLARFLFLSGSEILDLVRLGATSFLLASRVRGAPRGGDSRDRMGRAEPPPRPTG